MYTKELYMNWVNVPSKNTHHGLLITLCVKVLFIISIIIFIDGYIYAITPIDPLFLITPFIETHKNFESKSQLLYVSDDVDFNKCDRCDLELICDTQVVENETFYKFSHDKWMKFLEMKFNGLMNMFKEKQEKRNKNTLELTKGIFILQL